jgi:hypothetical protein
MHTAEVTSRLERDDRLPSELGRGGAVALVCGDPGEIDQRHALCACLAGCVGGISAALRAELYLTGWNDRVSFSSAWSQ